MPVWLVEGNPYVYFLICCFTSAFLYAWWRTRKPRYAAVAGALAALLLGYYALDRFVESDGEQMIRKVNEVATAVSTNDLDAAFRHVSDRFDRGGVNKDEFRRFCKQVKDAGHVGTVKVWDAEAGDISRTTGTGTVMFRFKVTGNWGESPPNYIGRIFLVLDSDGQWRVKSFDVYDSLNQSKTPLPIPSWGRK